LERAGRSAAATALWILRSAKGRLIQSSVAVPMNRDSATALQIKTLRGH